MAQGRSGIWRNEKRHGTQSNHKRFSVLSKSRRAFDWASWVLLKTESQVLQKSTLIQPLWGGYGELLRLKLGGGSMSTVVLKRVVPPSGVGETVSDGRKRRSYVVEQNWYGHWAPRCGEGCRVARCLGLKQVDGGSLLLLEDLEGAGFHPSRPPRPEHIKAGLHWLAHFHSRFMGEHPEGLWEQGNYWHLDTRAEEWKCMPSGPLKYNATLLDRRLKAARFQTLLHGDAKPANFCWHGNGTAAAVDFQYVGGGCGIRDVAYFLDSCLGDSGCESQADEWLNFYLSTLCQALRCDGHAIAPLDLEKEWRELFPVAWADFCRFEQGWGRPTPLGRYSQRQVDLALDRI